MILLVLELTQYKNDSIQSKLEFFDWMESFLNCLCLKGFFLIRYWHWYLLPLWIGIDSEFHYFFVSFDTFGTQIYKLFNAIIAQKLALNIIDLKMVFQINGEVSMAKNQKMDHMFKNYGREFIISFDITVQSEISAGWVSTRYPERDWNRENNVWVSDPYFLIRYSASQKHESTLLHTYVLNELLTANSL